MKIQKYDIVKIKRGYMQNNLAIVAYCGNASEYASAMVIGKLLWFPIEVLELVLHDVV